MALIRGDSAYWDIPLKQADGTTNYDLRGCQVWATCKRSTKQMDQEALYQHYISINAVGTVVASKGMTVGAGGVLAGVLVEHLTPAESYDFPFGEFVVDIQLKDINGDVWTTVLTEPEVVTHDVTRNYVIS